MKNALIQIKTHEEEINECVTSILSKTKNLLYTKRLWYIYSLTYIAEKV